MVQPLAHFARSLTVASDILPKRRRRVSKDAMSWLLKNHPHCELGPEPLMIATLQAAFCPSEVCALPTLTKPESR